ncbi:Ras family protein [Pelomyxa schiedti]|nr:Ras family protein [Pelomyxa schiedti]
MNPQSPPTRKCRVIMLGSPGVGKSTMCCVELYLDYDPSMEEEFPYVVTVDGEKFSLVILDTSSKEDESEALRNPAANGEAFMFVYSITSPDAFEKVKQYKEKILHFAGNSRAVPMVLCANKCDLTEGRCISTHEGEELAKLWLCPFRETSALTGTNIPEVFFALVREFTRLQHSSSTPESGTTSTTKASGKDPCLLS